MKNWFLSTLFLVASSLAANESLPSSDEEVHLNGAIDEIESKEIFNLIQGNVDNLKNRDASDSSANELINLIEEGYRIDPFNMSKLIETLTHRDASRNATRVILKAIEYNSSITNEHLSFLIQTLAHADASNNATEVILKTIEYGIKFTPKERLVLADVSKVVNAKKNVEKIRKALHERQVGS